MNYLKNMGIACIIGVTINTGWKMYDKMKRKSVDTKSNEFDHSIFLT